MEIKINKVVGILHVHTNNLEVTPEMKENLKKQVSELLQGIIDDVKKSNLDVTIISDTLITDIRF
jgi:hypothetical protein